MQSILGTTASNSNTPVKRFTARADKVSKARGSTRTHAIKEREARPENVPGSFYVDHTCIDCDTCRWMEPEVFGRVNGMTAVIEQPSSEDKKLSAAQALLACPTHSIHLKNQNGEIKKAAASFPRPIDGTQNLFHCGYHSEYSYGAASYLIKRDGGNVMVDSPRFDKTLLKNIKALGGAKYMVLSHKDDVCDHARWAEELGLERILHEEEITSRQGTDKCEVLLKGDGPWKLPDESKDIELILTPGHTEGHIVLLYQNQENPEENTCFTGDHLAFSRAGPLTIFKRVNWFSIPKQIESVAKLKDLPFRHILPGHGRPGTFSNFEEKTHQIADLLKDEGYSN